MTNGTSKQILLTRRSPAYWRVTFEHPPLNIFGPETIPQLNAIITALETDEQVKVVVIDSAVDGRPAAQARIRTLFERGFHKPGDVESRLGYHVGLLGSVENAGRAGGIRASIAGSPA